MALDASSNASILSGASWSAATSIFPGDQGISVSCATGGPCTAISYGGIAKVYTSSWNTGAAADVAPGNLTGVSCGTTTFCVGVDDAGHTFTYNGASWSAPRASGLGSLSAVSCSGTTLCVAVSDSGSAVVDKNGTWGGPVGIDVSALTSVSCPTPTFCAAADASAHVVTFNGSSWAKPTSLGVSPRKVRGFDGIACGSATFCVAIDTLGNELIFGKGKPLLHLADVKYTPITGISCAPTLCAAVDEEGYAILLHAVGSAKSWSRMRIDSYRLTAVSCTSIGFCLATDDAGGTVAFSGAWNAVSRTIPLSGDLTAVGCAGRGTCVVTDASHAAVGTAPV